MTSENLKTKIMSLNDQSINDQKNTVLLTLFLIPNISAQDQITRKIAGPINGGKNCTLLLCKLS